MRKLSALVLCLLPLTVRGITVSTAEGEAREMEAITLDDGQVKGGDLAGLKAEDLVQIVFGPSGAPEGKVEVRLATGDLLWGTLGTWKDGALALETPVLGARALKLEQIQSVIYAERLPGAAFAAMQDRLAGDRAGMDHDLCYLAGGDRVRFYLRSVDAGGVKGEDDDHHALSFPLDQVAALSLLATSKPPAPRGLQARLATRDGSVLVGALAGIGNGRLSLDHPLLGLLAIDLSRCAVLDVLGGRVLSLADLEPADVKEASYVVDPARPAAAMVFHYRRDRQVIDGRPLQVRGRTYARGLGVHSRCELGYDLGGAYARFRSDVGIDDSAKGGGSADAVVLLDGKERFRARVTGKDPPRRVDLDCRGAKRLTLILDFGEDREILDRAVWGAPVLVKEAP